MENCATWHDRVSARDPPDLKKEMIYNYWKLHVCHSVTIIHKMWRTHTERRVKWFIQKQNLEGQKAFFQHHVALSLYNSAIAVSMGQTESHWANDCWHTIKHSEEMF